MRNISRYPDKPPNGAKPVNLLVGQLTKTESKNWPSLRRFNLPSPPNLDPVNANVVPSRAAAVCDPRVHSRLEGIGLGIAMWGQIPNVSHVQVPWRMAQAAAGAAARFHATCHFSFMGDDLRTTPGLLEGGHTERSGMFESLMVEASFPISTLRNCMT
ncbi:hypothetical protein BC827DRAFT_1383813 [Russula dissimulans]|nr:hypothetical protein BC827DRAFT_1383813 [Russula dissimulans]